MVALLIEGLQLTVNNFNLVRIFFRLSAKLESGPGPSHPDPHQGGKQNVVHLEL